MKWEPISTVSAPRAPTRIHPAECDCFDCLPVREINLRRAVRNALFLAAPIYAFAWIAWTMLPR